MLTELWGKKTPELLIRRSLTQGTAGRLSYRTLTIIVKLISFTITNTITSPLPRWCRAGVDDVGLHDVVPDAGKP
jgi:hypothetical protein